MIFPADLLRHLQKTSRSTLCNPRIVSVGGGDINAAYRLQADGIDWFIKLNRAALADMFAAEAAGLQELASSNAIKVPDVIAHGYYQQHAYLILEYIPLVGLRGESARVLGHRLADLHRQPQAFFGWHIDNTIGSTPQHNPRDDDWVRFWREQRLARQLRWAAAQGFGGKLQTQGEKLLIELPVFFKSYHPQPSLLHGDLWGGNASADEHGQPVMFDPACYYGDREADLAMTELFGGFGRDFYAAYQAAYPLDDGYSSRKTLYNLYHILNHLNLFGTGYQHQAERMIGELLAQT